MQWFFLLYPYYHPKHVFPLHHQTSIKPEKILILKNTHIHTHTDTQIWLTSNDIKYKNYTNIPLVHIKKYANFFSLYNIVLYPNPMCMLCYVSSVCNILKCKSPAFYIHALSCDDYWKFLCLCMCVYYRVKEKNENE